MAVNGVESVSVSLEKGLAAVKLKPANTVTLKQLQAAIAKNGFTMKDSRMVAAGKVLREAGSLKFQITGSNEVLNLIAESLSATPPATNNATLLLDGTVLEATRNRSPDSVRYRLLTEEK